MRVCLVNGHMATLSGTPVHVAQLAAALGKRGCCVDLIFLESLHPELSAMLPGRALCAGDRGGSLLEGRVGAERLLMTLLRELGCGRERYDIVHAHYPDAGLAAHVADVSRGVPYVFSVHGYEAMNARRVPFQLSSLRSALTGASIVLPISAAVFDEVIDVASVPVKAVVIAPDGVNPCTFAARTEDRSDLTFRVGFVGRAVHEKGLDILCRAMEGLWRQMPRLVLVVAGDGTSEVLRKEASRLGCEVELHGQIAHGEVAQLLRGLDVLVAPSRSEGLGTVILEALATGLPVVASAAGGIPEVIRSGENGLLFTPGSVEELREVLKEVAGDRLLRRRLGQEALASSRRYNWDVRAEELLRVYEAAVGGTRVDGLGLGLSPR